MCGPSPRVSLVLTVKNEEATIPALLDSIAAQTLPPNEIVVVDGGSTDRTWECLESNRGCLPLILINLPEASISQGRNAALACATGDIIAVTDAGVRLDPRWLEELTAPFRLDGSEQVDVVSGFFRAHPQSFFEIVLGATTLPDEDEIDPSRFLPSSRSLAFRRSWYRAGIQYPEWLDYCEDLIFDLRLRRAGARFVFRPSAFVWFRPRGTVSEFFCQYYRYARGDGKAGLFARRHVVRYLTYLALIPLVLQSRNRRLAFVSAAAAALYMRRPWIRLWRRRTALGWRNLAVTLALAPLLRLTGDVAKMLGYPVGLVWRTRRFGLRRSWSNIPEQRNSARTQVVGVERDAQELYCP